MKILAAVDFSDASKIAGRAAARLALALDADLHLVHAAHLPGVVHDAQARPEDSEEKRRREQLLRDFADELRSKLPGGARLRASAALRDGLADEAVLALSRELPADLIVVGAIGYRPHSDASLGSTAMRVIKGATVPVFVVREDRSLERWLAGRSPLRVMIGVDPHKRAHAPLDWLTDWKRVGKLELAAAHVYAPGEERLRQVAAQREVELTAEVSSVLEPHSHLGSARVRLLGGFGRVAEHLLDLANAENADLLVVGTHRRTGWTRWVHGSVSLDIVAVARRNCVAVPILPPAAPATAPSTIRRVLVPVDFSDTTPRAVAWAMQLVPDGGTLQLVHVVAPFVAAATEFGTYVPLPAPTPEEQARERSETERKLRELVPDSARARSLSVEAHVLDGFDPATQIAAAARRLGSDVICLSTHGRSGLSRALLGSVAQGVVKRSSVPVFIVPPGERNRP